MKLLLILFMILAVEVYEGESFDFGSFFSSSYQSSSVSTSSSTSTVNESPYSNKPVDSELRQENEPFQSVEDFKLTYDESYPSSNETFGLQSNNITLNENSTVDNSTSQILNVSFDNTDTNASTSIQNEELLSQIHVTTERTLNESHTANIALDDVITSSNFSTEELEDVVLGTQPSTFTVVTKTIYQKTIEWVGDTYTLSILIPIAAGVLFAVTIIIMIACCRCIRRKCRRRRFRKRVLPDSIKSLRPSDQARLLGDCCDSSDDEF